MLPCAGQAGRTDHQAVPEAARRDGRAMQAACLLSAASALALAVLALARIGADALAMGSALPVAVLAAISCGAALAMRAAFRRHASGAAAAQAALADRNRALLDTQRRAEQQAAALQQNDRLLAERSRILKLTLEHISQGLMMVDAQGRVVVHNHRTTDVLDLPEELLAATPSFADVLAYQWQQGEFAKLGVELADLVRAGGLSKAAQSYRRERPDGRSIEVTSIPLPGGGFVRTYTDVTAEQRALAQVERMALCDELTGLPNRVSLRRELDRMLPARPDGVALVYLNLDGFRLLNDAKGHALGDDLLRAVSARLDGARLPGEVLARTGGDEFALVHPVDAASGAPAGDDGSERAAALLARLAEPYNIGGYRLTVTASVGVATSATSDGTDALLRHADMAMYRAKDAGGNQLCRFKPAMAAAQQERFMLEQDLRKALGTDALRVVYQPIISLGTDAIAGFESLLRWNDPARGDVSPADFIPVAESTGLIVPLGRTALETACAEAAGWAAGHAVAVNLSPAQFLQDDLLATVTGALDQSGLPAERLELEVTEGMLLQDTGAVRETMFALRDKGISLTLDDFGTGHAGLSYLRRFPFQKFKIDRSFVRNLGRAREADMIVEEMLALARRLGMRVVAEGVELESQLEHLRRLGCDFVQGYLTGRPVPPEVARTL